MNNPIRFTDPDGMGVGDYYTEEGEYLGTDGIDDNKAYVVTGFCSGTSNKTDYNFSKEALLSMSDGTHPILSAEDIGITNDELNLRASLSTLKQTEAGRLNEPLDYNSWNNNKNFTENPATQGVQKKYPMKSSANVSRLCGIFLEK